MTSLFDDLRTPADDRGLDKIPAVQPTPELREIEAFGPNPGNLRMLVHMPEVVQKHPALVVVLHGCTQTARGYDQGSGWSKLAGRAGFVLLYPEQRKRNNSHGCFNWFVDAHTRRDAGEPASIKAMIEAAVAEFRVDPRRIYICGLSAGGAMANVMLATYPEVFRAGAIIAGLPYGGASSASEALESMYNGRLKSAKSWGDLVRSASDHSGPWPQVAVWHGSADSTVKPINAGEIVKQWTDVHGLDRPPAEQLVGDVTRRIWADREGRAKVIDYSVPGMAHGTPVEGRGAHCDGTVGPYFLAAGLWSSLRIAQDWGLFDEAGRPRKPHRFRFLDAFQ